MGLKKFFYSVLIAVLAFSALPAFVVGSGSAENQYATVVWQTSVSKERLDRGEMFYGTLNLVSTIKAIPEAYADLVALANRVSARVDISYDLIARNNVSGEEIILTSAEISRDLPVLTAGARLEFSNERIPPNPDAYLVFPQEAEYGNYTLYIKLIKVDIVVLFLTKDVTDLIRDFLPPQAFGPGIVLAEVELAGIDVRARPAEFTATDLAITPEEVYTGEEVTISVLVTNVGELAGRHQVILKIDDAVEATQEVILEGGQSQRVSFTIVRDVAATYSVDVAGLIGTFAVKAPPFNWLLLLGIIAAVIVVGLVIFFVVRRRTT
ncbi:hypothetical protein M1O53_03685 [Dehalococcoidia bacterium]|nr:hypothetical protein [Dehalococcoidia bacterium]